MKKVIKKFGIYIIFIIILWYGTMHDLSIQVQVINLLYGCFARTEGIIHPAYKHNA